MALVKKQEDPVSQRRTHEPRDSGAMTGLRRLPVLAQDVLGAGAVLVVGWVAITAARDIGWWRPWLPMAYSALWATCAVLATRRRWPLTAFVVTAVGYPLVMVGPVLSEVQLVPLALACYGVTRAGRAPLWVAMLGGAASAVVLRQTGGRFAALWQGVPVGGRRAQLAYLWNDRLDLSALAFTVPAVGVCAVFGWLVHRLERQQTVLTEQNQWLADLGRTLAERNEQLERMREVDARRAAEAERTRIARELHDVVAHHVAAIAVRAQAAHRVADRDPAAVADAVGWIGGQAKEALDSMRRAVHVLRDSEPDSRVSGGPDSRVSGGPDDVAREVAQHVPAGSFDELRAVVARMRAAGLTVRLDLGDDLALAPVVALAATRIVREALTNVLIHSAAREASVSVLAADGGVQVEVADPGPRRPPPPGADEPTPGGNGIRNMRERARTVDGTLEAGPDGAGWRVRAWLTS